MMWIVCVAHRSQMYTLPKILVGPATSFVTFAARLPQKEQPILVPNMSDTSNATLKGQHTTMLGMAMGKRRRWVRQASMWIPTSDLPRSASVLSPVESHSR